MFKGCRKQMIVLRGTGSEIFDEAYFVLKNSGEGKAQRYSSEGERTAMLLEANRILEENRLGEKRHSGSYYALRYALFFLGGLLLGSGSILLSLAIS
ncbi:MAG: hypothetical protein IJZ89_03620 [Clostridia bacterium]|nr:hypothetical protein [Clostridia bacterium]